MTIPSPKPAAAAAGPVATHGCARCGAPVALDVGLCERCNPLGLRDVSSTQVHGTVFLAVGLAVVALAIVAHLAVAGIGPFSATVTEVREEGQGLAVTITVTNEGTAAGSTTCRVTDAMFRGAGPAAFLLSPRIGAGETITFDRAVPELDGPPRPLAVECSSP